MARILAVDDVPVSLRNHLVRSLRSLDEAVLLPQAERHDDTGVYKNVVFRIAGAEPHVPVSVFSPSWFTGISAVKVDGAFVTRILNDAQHRKQVLQRLRAEYPVLAQYHRHDLWHRHGGLRVFGATILPPREEVCS